MDKAVFRLDLYGIIIANLSQVFLLTVSNIEAASLVFMAMFTSVGLR